ncbi:MAG TPA: nucleotide exchange factor GrpE [Opitutaceae bacterium]|nr:nucleotide exchange factor GrpE [Opitutaceae bacterium]HRE07732.1 nucleotide exchange factor GrpE [Opitutaceae bacterium]
MNEPQPTPATTSTATSSSSDAAAAQASDTASLVNDTAALEAELARKETDLAAAKKEAADHYERYLRSVADLDNLRKRAVREKDELRQYAASRVLEDLIPVLDNLSLGLAAAKAPNADLKTLVGGVEMVLVQAKSSLAQHGLKEINPLGQVFDPNLHESISVQPSTEIAEGLVSLVVRTGYSLNGRLLRPASVILSSGAPKAAETSS